MTSLALLINLNLIGKLMPAIERISEMLRLANTRSRRFPATIFYNEGWLLRLVLDWFSQQAVEGHCLNFLPGARWYSEALLPSQFRARQRADRLAEGWTHADGVIGHVIIGDSALANTSLAGDAEQFVVTEAKLFSRLSPRVTNAVYFDQAARNVACIAQVLSKAVRKPDQISSLGFFVLAPSQQIAGDIFKQEMSKESIANKVSRRVSEYPPAEKGAKDEWYRDWFLPTLRQMRIESLSWEVIIDCIRATDSGFGAELLIFYNECLRFNRLQEPDLTVAS